MKNFIFKLFPFVIFLFLVQSCNDDKYAAKSENRSVDDADYLIVAEAAEAEPPRTGTPPPPPAQPASKEAPPQIKTLDTSNEEYATIAENEFHLAKSTPLSTFSVDVDRASYSNVRRFLMNNTMPPQNAVRIEEMINYFDYDYAEPKGRHPFAVHTEIADCPWNSAHKLVQIGLKGKEFFQQEMPASNLVFLLDVSGSMDSPNKLPLLKSAFQLLTRQLRAEDKVSIVIYAGATGVVLPPTSGFNQNQILNAINNLSAGGGTAGASGIELAYQMAERAFVKNGNNRVILATDGDFNIGRSSAEDLVKLIEAKREKDIFLTVLGFGMGNYKDHRMEQLANKGNGNYAYIDNFREAKKVLVEEMTSTLYTIAKDVKIQVEFNPAHVQSYRLIGYENRLLNKEDFNDDKKDAGEIGAGHTVTALYEIIPDPFWETGERNVDNLKYQNQDTKIRSHFSTEWLDVKLRYKKPRADKSIYLDTPVEYSPKKWVDASENFRFASSVAAFGMLLKNSKFKGNSDFTKVERWALDSMGDDENGYRSEFLELVGKAKSLKNQLAVNH